MPHWKTLALILFLAVAGWALTMALLSALARRPTGLGLHDGRLALCPDTPNCVCSLETEAPHAIEPIHFEGSAEEAWANLKAVLEALPRTTLVTQQPEYLHAECRSFLYRFVDDVEFHLDRQARLIHVRSASRAGRSDLGVNGRRVEQIRQLFAAPQRSVNLERSSCPNLAPPKKGTVVNVKVFDQQGQLRGPVAVNKVVKSDAEWQQQLTPDQFHITRNKGTERPFCGTLLDNKRSGVYTCVCCGLPLFASTGKFNSRTGWPSFFQAVAQENVRTHTDQSHGMIRTEILCSRCDAHLGHVFEDGPAPTRLRYCVNSESLAFTDEANLASLADPAAETAPPSATSSL